MSETIRIVTNKTENEKAELRLLIDTFQEHYSQIEQVKNNDILYNIAHEVKAYRTLGRLKQVDEEIYKTVSNNKCSTIVIL